MADVGRKLHKLCESHELLERGPGLRFFVRIENETRPAFVIRFAGKPCAYLNECAHQAVELDFIKGNFFTRSGDAIICATHGAKYDPAAGQCISGRCDGRNLRSLPVVEMNKIVSYVTETGIEFVSLDSEAK